MVITVYFESFELPASEKRLAYMQAYTHPQCVCMLMYVCTYMYICMHARMYVCVSVYTAHKSVYNKHVKPETLHADESKFDFTNENAGR
jgi:hypothetical protein